MSKVKLTISLDEELASYLRGTSSGVSSTIAEAVEAYRAGRLAAELEDAYSADAEEAERLNREWEPADAEAGE